MNPTPQRSPTYTPSVVERDNTRCGVFQEYDMRIRIGSLWERRPTGGDVFWSGVLNVPELERALEELKDGHELILNIWKHRPSERSPDAAIFLAPKRKPTGMPRPSDHERRYEPRSARDDDEAPF